jgi:hypothetical protein
VSKPDFLPPTRVLVTNADYLKEDTRIPVILVPSYHIPSSECLKTGFGASFAYPF